MSAVGLVVRKYGVSHRLIERLSRVDSLSIHEIEKVLDREFSRLEISAPDRALLKVHLAKLHLQNGNHVLVSSYAGGGEEAAEFTKGRRPAAVELLAAASYIRSVEGSSSIYEKILRIHSRPTTEQLDEIIQELTSTRPS